MRKMNYLRNGKVITAPTGQHWPWQYGARVAWATFAPSPATLAHEKNYTDYIALSILPSWDHLFQNSLRLSLISIS